jgi:MazG family protein
METLRDPKKGCSWDLEQTFATIAPYTIEEAYEVADAIDEDDIDQLEDELGDLLFQVVFYAQIASENGQFNFSDIARRIAKKMRDRHPHVFGSVPNTRSSADQAVAWETQKAKERQKKRGNRLGGRDQSAIDGIALALPALMRAQKLQKRASRVGFDWTEIKPVIAKIREELAEVEAELDAGSSSQRLQDEIGDLIFSSVNLARFINIDAEVALRGTNQKFERRFRQVEAALKDENKTLKDATIDEMESHWAAAKAKE